VDQEAEAQVMQRQALQLRAQPAAGAKAAADPADDPGADLYVR